jgi:hypothetical protein
MVFYFSKNDVTNILGPFDGRKVPESQDKQICSKVIKANERRSFRKSPESMENMSRYS